MKKHYLRFLCLLPLLAACGPAVASSSLSSSGTSAEDKVVQLFQDNSFGGGFMVSPADRAFEDNTCPDNRWSLDTNLLYGEATKKSICWFARQHGCIYGLGDIYNQTTGNSPTLEDGYYTFRDTSKRLAASPSKKSVILELNASQEYQHPRQAMEGWPHLLLEQGLSETIQISELSKLEFSVDLTMLKIVNAMEEGTYNPNLHTCQYLMYFVCNTASALDANDYLWFGVPFYDYRTKIIPESGQADAGTSGNTGKFIYSMSSESYLPNGVEVGVKNEIRIDLISEFGNGLLKAQEKGYLKNTVISDLSITYMNIGFEIPGTFDCAMQMDNFNLVATKK